MVLGSLVAAQPLARAGVRGVAALGLLTVAILSQSSAALAGMLKHIEHVTPRVGQRGTTVEVTIQGMCLQNAREIRFFRPGIRAVDFESLPDLPYPEGLAHGGLIREQFRCRFEIDADCPLGEHPFRVRTDTELTSIGTFHVTRLPVILENEVQLGTNNTLATAVSVPREVTVLGTISNDARDDFDVYRVDGRAGERLSVEVECVRLCDVQYAGPEFDLAARIIAADGRVLASNDDNSLLIQDPLVAVELVEDGPVFVEVRRSVFKDYVREYALHIGRWPRPITAYPPGGLAGSTQTFELEGDPRGTLRESITVPATTGTFHWFGEAPSPIRLRSSSLPNVLEDPRAESTAVPQLPAALNGRIETRGDRDAFRVRVSAGDRFRVRVFASTLGSPIDARLTIRPVGADGQPGPPEVTADDAKLTERDIFGTSFRSGGGLPEVFDPSVIWEPKSVGDYLIEVDDSSGSSGPTCVYRIEIEPPPNTLHLLLGSTSFDWVETMRTSSLAIPCGGRWTINLQLLDGQGSSPRGEVELFATGLPAGVEFVSPRVPAGRGVWPIQFVASKNAEPGTALIRIGARPVNRDAALETFMQQNIPYLNHPGGDAWRTVRLSTFVSAVTESAPFAIEIDSPPAALVRGGELSIPVRVTRREGFDAPIAFQCDWIPPGVGVPPTTIIPTGESTAMLRLSGEPNAPLGPTPLVITGTNVRDDLDDYLGTGRVRVSSSIVPLLIADPYVELASQPDSLRRGERKKFVWTIEHKSPFEGSATARLLGLPKGVKVVGPAPVLDRDSKELAFQLEATDDALLGTINGLSCEVTVQAAGQEVRQRTGRGTLRIDPRR